jgi:hypothetical protein
MNTLRAPGICGSAGRRGSARGGGVGARLILLAIVVGAAHGRRREALRSESRHASCSTNDVGTVHAGAPCTAPKLTILTHPPYDGDQRGQSRPSPGLRPRALSERFRGRIPCPGQSDSDWPLMRPTCSPTFPHHSIRPIPAVPPPSHHTLAGGECARHRARTPSARTQRLSIASRSVAHRDTRSCGPRPPE